jgi:hypothetical protein
MTGRGMDKVEFIRTAPAYYHAAIVTALRGTTGYFTIGQLRSSYVVSHDDEIFLEHEVMINLSLDKLVTDGAISKLADPFGDALYKKTDLFEQIIEAVTKDPSGPYFRNVTANDHNFWLRGALRRVNDEYRVLGLTPEDFGSELPDEWAPIQINPDEPAIQEAVRLLQEAATAIEQDNGYAATHPQERDQVVQDLKGGLNKLKSEAVSIGWLRRTVNALKTASFRFANTVKGQMIDGALSAIKDVIKHHIGSALEGFWSLFF